MASMKATSSVFADAWDDEGDLIAMKTAPTLGDVRKVEYSAEMAAVGFPLKIEMRNAPQKIDNSS